MRNVKKRFIPQIIDIDQDSDSFKNLLESVNIKHVKEDTVIKGQVISVDKEVVVVDVGLKNEGRIPVEEFATGPNQTLPEVGDVIDIYIEKIEGKNGRTVLSRLKAIIQQSWVNLELAYEKKEFVQGAITGRIKGGLTVDLSGVIAFLPGSQIDVRPIKDVSSLMGITQPFLILKMDKKFGNIVVSRRAILEESRSEARDEMLAKIKEGEIYDGVVKNITDYGAFVDLGNIDGLLHVTDISWGRINHPSEVLSIGQKVKVMVIKFNEESKRISLGMKQLDDSLWHGIEEEFPVGAIFTGKVTSISDYGAFVECKNGIEGLVHATEISWLKSKQNPKKSLVFGQEVRFKILEIDTKKHRISLSIKQCEENPLIAFAERHPVGSIIKAPVRNITDFGIFVSISEQFDGMIHESDISWESTGESLLQSFKKGMEVECKILSIDVEKERVSLGIKQLTEKIENQNSSTDLKKNMTITCTVVTIKDDGIEVSIDDQTTGFIKKADLSSEKSSQKPELFAIGERVDAKVISVDAREGKATLSIKALEVDERKKAIKEYGSTDSGARLGDILGAALGEKDNKNSD